MNIYDTRSFHIMGIISMPTCYTLDRPAAGKFIEFPVQRLQRTKIGKVVRNPDISVVPYFVQRKSALSLFKFIPLSLVQFLCIALDFVWNTSWRFYDAGSPRANWSGFMLNVLSERSFSVPADIGMLPIIVLKKIFLDFEDFS